MSGWRYYQDVAGPDWPGVARGALYVHPWFYSPQLEGHRRIYVYIPYAAAEADGPLPVLYMHDGQNLFDPATSVLSHHAWHADQAIYDIWEAEERASVIVAIESAHSPDQRARELSPLGGDARKYLSFLVDTVRPAAHDLVRSRFPLSSERDDTGIMGASLGGLISLEAFFSYPQIFGYVGCMSPPSQNAATHVPRWPYRRGRIYLDDGGRENGCSGEPFYRLLCQKGYEPGETIRYVHEQIGEHTEAAWARRLPEALRFLLPARQVTSIKWPSADVEPFIRPWYPRDLDGRSLAQAGWRAYPDTPDHHTVVGDNLLSATLF